MNGTLTTLCYFKRPEFIWDPAIIRIQASEPRHLLATRRLVKLPQPPTPINSPLGGWGTTFTIAITQPGSWYSFYRPTDGRRLSRPRWLTSYVYIHGCRCKVVIVQQLVWLGLILHMYNNGLHLTMHQTITLTGYIRLYRTLTLALVCSSVRPIVHNNLLPNSPRGE